MNYDHPQSWRIIRFLGWKRCLALLLAVLMCCVLLALHLCVDVYVVTKDSMAPALIGDHRATNCPDCGALVRVGVNRKQMNFGVDGNRLQFVTCWNCEKNLNLADFPILAGNKIIVDKTAYLFRSPKRWDIVVFRLFGVVLVKRIVGLPGETVEIKDGDVYVNGQIARKSAAIGSTMRIPILDIQTEVPIAELSKLLSAKTKSGLFSNESTYNHAHRVDFAQVHDFILECQLHSKVDSGELEFQLTDGDDLVVLRIPTIGNGTKANGRLSLHRFAATAPNEIKSPPILMRDLPEWVCFRGGKWYDLKLSMVDGRFIFSMDGQEFTQELPAPNGPPAPSMAFSVDATDTNARVRRIRLFRDVHYTQDGRNAVGGKPVHLGPNQYFVLGDNSAVSEDSRFWPNGGAIPEKTIIGRAAFVSPTALPTVHRRISQKRVLVQELSRFATD